MMVLQLLHSKTAGKPADAVIQHTTDSSIKSWHRQAVIGYKCMRGIETAGKTGPSNVCTQNLHRAPQHCAMQDRCKTGAVCANVGEE